MTTPPNPAEIAWESLPAATRRALLDGMTIRTDEGPPSPPAAWIAVQPGDVLADVLAAYAGVALPPPQQAVVTVPDDPPAASAPCPGHGRPAGECRVCWTGHAT